MLRKINALERYAMQHDVSELPRAVQVRECPQCGYRQGQILIDRARFNFECFRCRKTRLSDYAPIKQVGSKYAS